MRYKMITDLLVVLNGDLAEAKRNGRNDNDPYIIRLTEAIRWLTALQASY